jgi:RimJ/RimL family protein N-acetyltransferase
LGRNHRQQISSHLLSLDPQDRYLRFGYSANDEQIQRYVDGLDFHRDEVFGIYNRKLALIAMAHLAHVEGSASQECAEFGLSVVKSARGRGYGARLFERAAMHACNDGITCMIIHALSENIPMLRIARKAGAAVTREGSESEGFLRLPVPSLDSRVSEIVYEQFAQVDYHIKEQAQHFHNLILRLQSMPVDCLQANGGRKA